jgi:hypothetical protein
LTIRHFEERSDEAIPRWASGVEVFRIDQGFPSAGFAEMVLVRAVRMTLRPHAASVSKYA